MNKQLADHYELLKQGAEAKLYKGIYLGKPVLIKERFVKGYRHPDLDLSLSRERIKAESRAIIRCKNAGIRTPSIYLVDLCRRSIYMEYFEDAVTVKDYLQQASYELVEKVAKEIGNILAKMHSSDVIHGDLTTSNMLVLDNNDHDSYKRSSLVMIDFGLAHMDSSAEDKAVDLYVLERALVSTHDNPQKIFSSILKSYNEHSKGRGEVLSKLEEVRARGRKRVMIG